MGLFPPAPGGGQQVEYGYKGKGVIIHILADSHGRPILIKNTGAKGNEKKQAVDLLIEINTYDSIKQKVVQADRGYDAYWLRREVLQMGALPLIPYRKHMKGTPVYNTFAKALTVAI